MLRFAIAFLAVFVLVSIPLASDSAPMIDKPGDYRLIDENGNPFNLKEFSGSPYIVSFIYTDCAHVCPLTTRNLKRALNEVQAGYRGRFNVLTIGFDVENDTPERLKAHKENFALPAPSGIKDWRFAAADAATIGRVTRDFGFYYKKEDGGFVHANMLTIVDGSGKIYKQIYGDDFRSSDLLTHLYEAIDGKGVAPEPAGILDRIKLFCYTYDPTTGEYRLDYGFLMVLILSVTAELMVLSAIIYIFLGRRIRGFLPGSPKQNH